MNIQMTRPFVEQTAAVHISARRPTRRNRISTNTTRKAATAALKAREAINTATTIAAQTATSRKECEDQLQRAREANDSAAAAAATGIADCKTALAEIKRLRSLDARTATRESQAVAAIIQRAIRAGEMAQRYANRARNAARVSAQSSAFAAKVAPSRLSQTVSALFRQAGFGVQSVEELRREAVNNAAASVAASKITTKLAANARSSAEAARRASEEARRIFDDAMNALIRSWEKVAVEARRIAHNARTAEEALAATQEAELALRTVEILAAAKI